MLNIVSCAMQSALVVYVPWFSGLEGGLGRWFLMSVWDPSWGPFPTPPVHILPSSCLFCSLLDFGNQKSAWVPSRCSKYLLNKWMKVENYHLLFVYQACCHKILQNNGLKQQKFIYFLSFLSLKQDQGASESGLPELVSLGWYIAPWSPLCSHMALPLCVCPCCLMLLL